MPGRHDQRISPMIGKQGGMACTFAEDISSDPKPNRIELEPHGMGEAQMFM